MTCRSNSSCNGDTSDGPHWVKECIFLYHWLVTMDELYMYFVYEDGRKWRRWMKMVNTDERRTKRMKKSEINERKWIEDGEDG